MVLRQLRSLVVAYDHLSDDRRKELTTALEIIKNREVLNRVRYICPENRVFILGGTRGQSDTTPKKMRITLLIV